MELSELYKTLKENGISDDSIYLHGLYGSTNDDEKLSLTTRREKYSLIWEIYFKERGSKHSIIKFNNESEACEHYLKKMIKHK
jgi:hypothetical protein